MNIKETLNIGNDSYTKIMNEEKVKTGGKNAEYSTTLILYNVLNAYML